MSKSLIRRGIDLYKDDLDNSETKTVRKMKNIKSSKLDDKEITSILGTNKKGYKRKLKRLQTKQNTATLKDKKVKSVDDLYEMYTKRDQTQDNIKALNYMRLLNTDEKKTIEQAAKRHQDKKNKKKKQNDPKESTEQTSAFSEKEFEDFFKDYNFT